MNTTELNTFVLNSKSNLDDINKLLEQYKPYIKATASKRTGKFISVEDEEFSIALSAFSEAIKNYNNNKGNFLSFANDIISKRLIDLYRKNKNDNNLIYFEDYKLDEHMSENGPEQEISLSYYNDISLKEERKFEIIELNKEIKAYKIDFFQLEKISPNHEKTRALCKNIIDFVIKNDEAVKHLKEKKELPLAIIENGLNIKRKQFERYRKYIITVVIIEIGDYPCLRSFIKK